MQSKNPYLSIWFNTKSTVDRIKTGQIKFRFYIPIILAVISSFIGKFNDIIGDDFLLIIITTAITVLIGFLVLGYLLPWIIQRVGKIWNGQGNLRELQIIVGLAQIPILLILFEQIVFLTFGKVIIDAQVNILIRWIAWIFYMRILIIGIAKIQNFNYGIAILNLAFIAIPVFILQLTLN